jgi:hypothetical protein
VVLGLSCAGYASAPSNALSWLAVTFPDPKFILNCSENRLVGVGSGYNGTGSDTTGTIFVASLDDTSMGHTSQLATNQVLKGGTYGAGVFVVVGQKAIYSSTDGAVWKRQATLTNTLNACVFGAGEFVAVGDAGTVLTSRDGTNWTSCDSGTDTSLRSVRYGNGLFLAVGDVIITSPDGTTWTERATASSPPLIGAAYGNGTYLAVGGDGSSMTSRDGITWGDVPPSTNGLPFLSVAFGNGMFLAVRRGNFGGDVFASLNGQVWTPTSPVHFFFYDVTFGAGRFFGASGFYGLVSSSDGNQWDRLMNAFYSDVAYGNGQFVGLRSDTNGIIGTSFDGIHWAPHATGVPGHLFKMVYANNAFVAAGQPGILTSTDGTNWVQTVTGGPSDYIFTGIAYGNGAFVVRVAPATYVSSDGFNWVKVSQPIATLGPLAFANGKFVNFGESGSLAISTNGVDWVSGVTGIPGIGPVDVAGIHDQFVAPIGFLLAGPTNGTSDAVMMSSDAVNWSFPTEVNAQVTVPISRVGFAGDLAFLFGNAGEIFTSSDLTNWVQTRSDIGWGLMTGVAFGANRFVAVGNSTLVSTPYSPSAVTGRFTDIQMVAAGSRLSITADLGATVGVEASTDLATWVPLANVNFPIPSEQITDGAATNLNARFYRISAPSNGVATLALKLKK